MSVRNEHLDGEFEVDLVEYLTVIGRENFKLDKYQRRIWSGTNQSNHIGPVGLNVDANWKLTFKQKKELLGSRRNEVGGPTEQSRRTQARNDDDIEPVGYHSNSVAFWVEFLRCFKAACVQDLTALDIKLAKETTS